MDGKKRIYIVIPVYNEASVIGSVLKELQRAGYANLIVVDDGSTDTTSQIARESHAITLRHSLNRGKGAAVRTGIEAARMLDADIVVTFDGDGQHDPEDIQNLAREIENGQDVVLGKRNFDEKHIPYYRAVANRIGNFITWVIYGLWVNDSQSGLRAYSRRAFDLIQTETDRYEYDSEVIREIAKHKLAYSEVLMHVRYTSYSQQKKHKQSFVNGLKTFARLLLNT